jgi:cytochrome c oxidase subunit 4
MAHDTQAHAGHPTAQTYVVIGIILAVITAVEVGLFLIEGVNSAIMTFMLLGLSLLKFVLVMGWFMHLKADDNRFTLLFVAPAVVMISIMVALLALFGNLTR